MNSEYLATINRFSGLNVLVIGDAMLDVYLDGSANRICTEAPVPIVDIKDVKAVPGGAANTAGNLAQLGAEVHYLSVAGCDHAAELLKEAVVCHGLDFSLIICDEIRRSLTEQCVAASAQLLVCFDTGTTEVVCSLHVRQMIPTLKEKFH